MSQQNEPPPLESDGGSKRLGGDLLSHQNGSTIGAAGLNGSVRNGKRWGPRAIATKKSVTHGQPEQDCTEQGTEVLLKHRNLVDGEP